MLKRVEIHDERLQVFRDLKSTRVKSDHLVVEGRYCVKRLASSRLDTTAVLVKEGCEHEIASWFPRQTSVYVCSREEIRSLVGFDFHRGVLAAALRPNTQSIGSLCVPDEGGCFAVALVGVSDADNVGSIIRTATAFGIHQLIVDQQTIDVFSRRVVRVSMGTVFHQQIISTPNMCSDLVTLARAMGARTIASTLGDGAVPLHQISADDRPVILVVGNEAMGLPGEVQDSVSDLVTIPMKMATDSLNVSVATAIFLYELCR